MMVRIRIENKNILKLEIGIKKKNYNSILSKNDLINSLTEVKDLFKESYQDEKIMHIIVNKYIIKTMLWLNKQALTQLNGCKIGLMNTFNQVTLTLIKSTDVVATCLLRRLEAMLPVTEEGNYPT